MPSEADWEGKIETIREREGLNSWAVVGVGAGTAVFLAATLGALWLFYNAMGQYGTWPSPAHYAGPQLQSDPAGDLRDLLQTQTKELQSYGWVDRAQGVIRVPIDRAMAIVAARGAAAYDPPAGTTSPAAQAANAKDSRRPGP